MTAPPAAHPDDGALLRWLDGEPEPAAVAHAPDRCPVCAARVAVLRRRAAGLRALLAATDEPAPAPPDPARVLALAAARTAAPAARTPPSAVRRAGWRARPGARLAAAGVALAAASLAAQPVRQWVAARWARLTGAAGAAPPAAAPAPGRGDTLATLPPRPSVVVTFTPAAGPFTVRFDARPAGGALRLTTGRGAGASAAVEAAEGAAGAAPATEDLLVLPDGVRVRNRAGSARVYWVTVPSGTARVRLTFGRPAGDTVVTPDPDAPVTVPLGRP